MKTTIPSIFIVALVALFGCALANAADDDFNTLTKLAEQGNASAQFILGLTYAEGRGVPKDDTEADINRHEQTRSNKQKGIMPTMHWNHEYVVGDRRRWGKERGESYDWPLSHGIGRRAVLGL